MATITLIYVRRDETSYFRKDETFKVFQHTCYLLLLNYNIRMLYGLERKEINSDFSRAFLKGNHAAIEILKKYPQPSKLDNRLVYEALNDNEYAINVLGIDKVQ